MLLTALMVVTAAPLHNADAADVEEAGLVWGRLARQVANPGIASVQLSRALAPVYGVTCNRDAITPDAFGGDGDINRVCCLLRNSPWCGLNTTGSWHFLRRLTPIPLCFPLNWRDGVR